MYNIQLNLIVQRRFVASDRKVEYICIGYGDATETGRLLIVGAHSDPNGEVIVRTFRDNEVTFLPQPTAAP